LPTSPIPSIVAILSPSSTNHLSRGQRYTTVFNPSSIKLPFVFIESQVDCLFCPTLLFLQSVSIMRGLISLTLLPLLASSAPTFSTETIHEGAAPLLSASNAVEVPDSYIVVFKDHVTEVCFIDFVAPPAGLELSRPTGQRAQSQLAFDYCPLALSAINERLGFVHRC
jgi:hypothetical protein